MNDWLGLVGSSPLEALGEQTRIRGEFEAAFRDGLIVRGFSRDDKKPTFLLFQD
jgi:hypothetical protein